MADHDERSRRFFPDGPDDSVSPESASMIDPQMHEGSDEKTATAYDGGAYQAVGDDDGATDARRRKPWKTVVSMAIFFLAGLAFMGAHLGFFLWLDGQAVSSSGVSQASQSAVANFFAIAVEIGILGGVGIAYDQFLWGLFRHKSLKASTIDTLVTLAASPWHLWRPDAIREATVAVFIATLCALIPVAAVFPPGSLSVEFQEGVVPFTMNGVPTMNVSDYGNGTTAALLERSMFQLSTDLDWLTVDKDTLFNPRLASLATGVLAFGRPLPFESPCRGSCVYDMNIIGPRFSCRNVTNVSAGLITEKECKGDLLGEGENKSLIYRSQDKARVESGQGTTKNNTWMLSWYPNPIPDKCDPYRMRTLDCYTTMTEYKLHIDMRSDSRDIKVELGDDEELWGEHGPDLTFYNEAFGKKGNIEDPKAMSKKWAIAQSYAISRAAITAMAGDLRYRYLFEEGGKDIDYNGRSYEGNASTILGSPYASASSLLTPKFNLTGDSIQQYLQDLVISTITMSDPANPLWTYQDAIQAKSGANVYTFNEPLSFYVPYGMILIVTAGIYIVGLWTLKKNGVSAGGSFLQFAMTTSTSKALNQKAATSSIGGDENASQALQNLRLRFGRSGFGTENELEES